MAAMEVHGSAGSAFEVSLPPGDDRPNPDTMTCLGRWNLRLPGQHPLWDRYSLMLCHLRDCTGITPANKQFPEATHEICVFAVNPDFPDEQFRDGGVAVLEPVNHVCQFTAGTDLLAVDCARHMVQRLVDGQELAEPSGITGARDRFKASVNEYLAG